MSHLLTKSNNLLGIVVFKCIALKSPTITQTAADVRAGHNATAGFISVYCGFTAPILRVKQGRWNVSSKCEPFTIDENFLN